MFTPGTHAWTRSGWRVEVVAVLPAPDVNGDSIIGLLHDSEGAEITTWRKDGRFRSKHISGLDLVEAAQ
jgi:hypothetical protein